MYIQMSKKYCGNWGEKDWREKSEVICTIAPVRVKCTSIILNYMVDIQIHK